MYESLDENCCVRMRRWLRGESSAELYERRRAYVSDAPVGSVKSVKRGDVYYYERSIAVVIKRIDKTNCLIVSTFHYGPVTNNDRYSEHVVKIENLGVMASFRNTVNP